jgi:hypothetical protein
MPYVNCARCELVNFTVAYWSHVDRCAGCGEPLPRPTGAITAASLRAGRVGDERARGPLHRLVQGRD